MPDILFKCRSCGNQLVLAKASAGTQIYCPQCGSSLTVPKTAIVYTCPQTNCSRVVQIDIALKGDGLHCPGCNKPMMLPIRRANVIICLCKRCEKIIEIPISEAGKLLPCPKCDDWIMGPELDEIADASAVHPATDPLPPLENGSYAMTLDEQTLSVLVVDDNPGDQRLAAIHLREMRALKRGIEFEYAMDGKEALAKLRSKRFALVVLDWNLPLLGQGEVLRHLRKNGSRIPVVVMTGVAQHHLAPELEALKAAFLSKYTMSPETFHIVICLALALVDCNVSHFFEHRIGKAESPG